MDKQNEVYPCNERSFSNNMKGSTDKYYNMSEPKKTLCYVKETNHKDHIL